ncbi:MAG: hypothetical protein HY735_08580 [Verrucomicrobia bacterium]|nr:hypothetical protein [Verrucomicrobiota bacterium]
MRVKTYQNLAAIFFALGLGIPPAKAAAPAQAQGNINFRTYAGDQRAAIRARTATPDGSYYPKRAEGPYNGWPGLDPGDDDTRPVNIRENYNMELIGYFYPPKAGKIQFAISTDDPGELWVSTDDNPVNKVQVASESQWNPIRAFGGGDPTAPTRRTVVNTGDPSPRPQNWSPYLNVVAGKPYFIQSIATEFGGGDNSAIAFRYEGDADFQDGDLPIAGKYLSPFYLPTNPVILAQPKDVYTYAGASATFSFGVDVGPTATISSIKWQKNGTDVPNSDTQNFTVAAAAADDGAKFKAVVNTSVGSITTAEATLTVATLTSEFAPGVMKFEAWRNIGGNAVQGLKDDPRYPATPDDVNLVLGYEGPTSFAEAYGSRVSGYIIPPTTGKYVFFLSTDDNGELFLSTDDNPANKKLIAQESNWSSVRQWTTSGGSSDLSSKRSDQFGGTEWPTGATITLTAGKRYYTEMLQKEGGGGDNGAVTWKLESDPDPANGTLALIGSIVGANARPNKGDVQITKQPQWPAQLEEGRSYRFTVDGVITPAGYNFPMVIQWQKDGAAIAGANAKAYVIQAAKASDAGTYRVVLSAPSGKSATSTEAKLAVVPDTFAPVATASAILKAAKQEVSVAFDEAIKAATASASANYSLSAGTIDSVRVVSRAAAGFDPALGVSDYTSGAVLTVSGLTAGQAAQLTVKNVEDMKGNKNATGQTVSFTAEGKKTWTVVGANESGFANDVVRVGDEGFDVISSGVAFWADYDEATFVNEAITGNFDKIVQLEYQDPSSQWSRCGLMAREGLDEGKKRPDRGACTVALEADGTYCVPKDQLFSRIQTVHANPTIRWDLGTANNAYENHWRAEDTFSVGFGNQMNSANGGFGPLDYPNVWMRMQRQGNVLNTFRSTDGQTWNAMTSRQFSNLAPTLYVGPFLAPELDNNGTKDGVGHGVLARFRNYRDFGPTGPTPGAKLAAERTATGIKITFAGTLQSADAVTGPWTDVAGAKSPAEISFSGTGKFYRSKE